MTAPTTTRPRIIERPSGLYVHEPATDPDHPANTGKCLAYARQRVADKRWEVRVVGNRDPIVDYATVGAARDKLTELTGAVI